MDDQILTAKANGALMRISPLGIFGANHDLKQVEAWAQQDASLTHPHPVCLQAKALFAMAIAHAVKVGPEPRELHEMIGHWAEAMEAEKVLREAISRAATTPPSDYVHQQGWVVIAFHNALWQLCHAPTLEEGVVDTIMHGGDTDTNAAIAGALLGAVYGREVIPDQWVTALLNCRPKAGQRGVRHPRPKCFWPVDAMELAQELVLRRYVGKIERRDPITEKPSNSEHRFSSQASR